MPRRSTHIAAVLLTALACGLGAAACGGGGPSREEQAARARWKVGVPEWRAQMVLALNELSLMLSSPQAVADLRQGKTQALARLDRSEERLEGCADAIGQLGEAPGALDAVRKEALKTCHALVRGAALVRDGIAAWRAGLRSDRDINRAGTVLGRGQRGLDRVRVQLRSALSS